MAKYKHKSNGSKVFQSAFMSIPSDCTMLVLGVLGGGGSFDAGLDFLFVLVQTPHLFRILFKKFNVAHTTTRTITAVTSSTRLDAEDEGRGSLGACSWASTTSVSHRE
jgi:hypothetical protein